MPVAGSHKQMATQEPSTVVIAAGLGATRADAQRSDLRLRRIDGARLLWPDGAREGQQSEGGGEKEDPA